MIVNPLTGQVMNSYFSECPRDDQGHCKSRTGERHSAKNRMMLRTRALKASEDALNQSRKSERAGAVGEYHPPDGDTIESLTKKILGSAVSRPKTFKHRNRTLVDSPSNLIDKHEGLAKMVSDESQVLDQDLPDDDPEKKNMAFQFAKEQFAHEDAMQAWRNYHRLRDQI